MNIQFIPNSEIDKTKWNSCVHFAGNGNIFGYKWYLDNVAKEWHGLIEGDYESVLPLVWQEGRFNKKKSLYQPVLARELGIYSINVLSEKRIRNFLEAIPEEYQHVDICLNERIKIIKDANFDFVQKLNYQLLLDKPYEELQQEFPAATLEAIHKAEAAQLFPTTSLKPEDLAALFRKYPSGNKVTESFHAIQRIIYNALHRGWGFISAVQNQQQELLAANFFIYSHKKVVSLFPVVTPAGKTSGAMEYLFHTLLSTHAGKSIILDFNGNEKMGKAFGAGENPYLQMRSMSKKWKIF